MEELVVDLNRSGVNTVEPRQEHIETERGLSLRFRSHDRPVRVHLRLDGDWSELLTVEATNALVTPDAERTIELVPPASAAPTGGTVQIETGYGATSQSVTVDITGPTEQNDAPSKSPEAADSEDRARPDIDTELLGLVAILIFAVGIAGGVVAIVGPQLPVIVAAGLVIATAVVGTIYFYR